MTENDMSAAAEGVEGLREAKAIAAAVLQSACETDPADPEHPDTIMITCDDLECIVRVHAEEALARAALARSQDNGGAIRALPIAAATESG